MGFETVEYLDNEEFKQINGFAGLYAISTHGRVMRLTGGHHKTYAGKILKHLINRKTGYPYVKLCKGGKVYKRQLHLLVAYHFLDLPENYELMVVNHKDGNKENPVKTNLEFITFSENTKHAIETGLQTLCYGKNNGASKLSYDDVLRLREEYKSKDFTIMEIAERFGITTVHASNIIKNKTRVGA